MKNSKQAYLFWKKTIKEYTSGNYIVKNSGESEIFVFNNK